MTRFIKWLSLNSRNCHTLCTCTVRNTGGKTTRKIQNIQFIMEFSIYIYWNDDREIVFISTFSS